MLLLLPVAISHQVRRGYALPRHLVVLLAAPLAAGLLADLALTRRLPGIRRGFPALLLLEVAALSASMLLRATDLRRAFLGSFEHLLGLASYLAVAVLALAAYVAVWGSQSRFRWLLRALAAAGVLIVAMGPCRQQSDAWRWTGALGHANYTANALLLPLFSAVGLVLGARRRWESLLWAAGAAAMAVEIFLLQTRGAWLGALAGAAVVAALLAAGPLRLEGPARRRAGIASAIGAAAVLLLLAAVLAVPSWRERALARASAALRVSGGSSSRLEAWRSAGGFLRDHALIGTGPEGFRNAFLPYKSEDLGRSLGRQQLRDLHSLPLQALAEGGAAGLAAFVGLVACGIARLARAIADRRLERGDRWLAAGLLAAIAAHLAHGFTICHVVAAAALWHVALGAAAGAGPAGGPPAERPAPLEPARLALRILSAVLALALFAAIAWHGARLWRGDRALLLSLAHGRAAERGGGEASLQAAIAEGVRAVEHAPGVGEYHGFLASTIAQGLEAPGLERSPRRAEYLELGLRHATEALRRGEHKENYTLELARLHWFAGRSDLAEKEARASIAIDGSFFQSRRILALLLLDQERFEEARQEAEAVERLQPGLESERLRALIEGAGAAPVRRPTRE